MSNRVRCVSILGVAKMTEPSAAGDGLLNIQAVAERLQIAESTAWLIVKRHNLPRYRLPGRGKTVYFRWADVETAYNTPVQVGGAKKADPLAA